MTYLHPNYPTLPPPHMPLQQTIFLALGIRCLNYIIILPPHFTHYPNDILCCHSQILNENITLHTRPLDNHHFQMYVPTKHFFSWNRKLNRQVTKEIISLVTKGVLGILCLYILSNPIMQRI